MNTEQLKAKFEAEEAERKEKANQEKVPFVHQPMYDRLVVERVPEVSVAKGGIIIPDGARQKQAIGTVVAIGQGRLTPEGAIIPLIVKVDDIVLFDQYGGEDIKIDGKDYLIIKENCIQLIKKTPLVIEPVEVLRVEPMPAPPKTRHCISCGYDIDELEWDARHSTHTVRAIE